MNISELIPRILLELEPLLVGVAAVVAATVVAMLCILIRARSVWVKHKRFALPSLFFGLNNKNVVRLACAWMRLIFPIVFLLSLKEPVLIQYLMILIPGLILVILSESFLKAISTLLYLVLELAGIFSAGLICGYITEVGAGAGLWLIYGAIGIFMVLFMIYLFLQDIERISMSRKIRAKQIWGNIKDEAE